MVVSGSEGFNFQVGLVIGKGGETIKNIQSRSGARVQVGSRPLFPSIYYALLLVHLLIFVSYSCRLFHCIYPLVMHLWKEQCRLMVQLSKLRLQNKWSMRSLRYVWGYALLYGEVCSFYCYI